MSKAHAHTAGNPVYFSDAVQISRRAWTQLSLGMSESPHGLPMLAQDLAARLNAQGGQTPARVGEVLALGLLAEVFRFAIYRYAAEVAPGVLDYCLERGEARTGHGSTEQTLRGFATEFPPDAVRSGRLSPQKYLQGGRPPVNHRGAVLREALILSATLENPAAERYRILHHDGALRVVAPWPDYIRHIELFLVSQPPHPETGLSIPDLLRAPARACPDSLEGQLSFILDRWQAWLPPAIASQLRRARGMIREESHPRGAGPGPIEALRFGPGDETGYAEPEQFTPDRDWMPNVVLIAKTIYVWLDQLSRKYQRHLYHLDHIPDEELATLAEWGFTGLWLIGVWERSRASKEIKRRCGNPEAEASAYSLYDYTIAADLGGYEAYRRLSDRAWRHGIRLASDMVPNHMGIDSRWVLEHPDWFIQVAEPPFPAYRFTGPDLSPDPRVCIQIEDGYWSKTDAAVVFRREDRWTGETRYIYHGNDGTRMPWNDTAQLNFLVPQVREAVIETILHVARLFPIIRFDAAMTLAKRHYQRLWFPKPGDEGAIPSRATHGMSRAEFDAVFPEEFWRQVVDRVAQEAPDTLLLAEAFWLMEGYFVRTLGMHRVYNSAFMNMLKMEENAKFRQTIKNVLEFSPEVLQRFVNFMNNPDEDTAEAQFGKGDKYFGVCVLMATMPGLPMFGHGQIEGYTEKYGMEYRRAYRDEAVDEGLVQRHRHDIFPLLRRRQIFSGAAAFALFDFVVPEGWVNEDVIAYVNGRGSDRALVVYHNRFADTSGRLQNSTAINVGAAESPEFVRRSLAEALGLHTDPRCYCIFREQRSGLEYLEHAARIAAEGMPLHLGAYDYRVYLDWRMVWDDDLSWARLHARLQGRGVPSILEAREELVLEPVLAPFRAALQVELFQSLLGGGVDPADEADLLAAWTAFFRAAAAYSGGTADAEALASSALARAKQVLAFSPSSLNRLHYPEVRTFFAAQMPPAGSAAGIFWRVPLTWALLGELGAAAGQSSGEAYRRWLLYKTVAEVFASLGGSRAQAEADARLVGACLAHVERVAMLHDGVWGPETHALFTDPLVMQYLGLHRWDGREWIYKERLESLLRMLVIVEGMRGMTARSAAAKDRLMFMLDTTQTILDAAADTGYDFRWMLDAIK
jgi:glycosidase